MVEGEAGDSRADGKGERGFLQRSVGSEAFDSGSQSKMLSSCPPVKERAKRRAKLIVCSALGKLVERGLFTCEMRNVRCSLCGF